MSKLEELKAERDLNNIDYAELTAQKQLHENALEYIRKKIMINLQKHDSIQKEIIIEYQKLHKK